MGLTERSGSRRAAASPQSALAIEAVQLMLERVVLVYRRTSSSGREGR